MKRAQLLALLFGTLLVLAPLARADEYDDGLEDEEDEEDDHAHGGEPEVHDPDTVVGTAANFDEVVLKAPFALVEFYAPWCGHCKTLAPHYAKAATLLRDYTPKVAIVKVDATKENQLGQKYGIQGFPTIKWFIDGEVVADYDGGRDTESIVTWIKKKTGPAAVTISSADELTKLEAENQVIGVGYFKAFEGSEYDAFKKAAIKVDALFVQTTSAEVAAVAGLKEHGLATIKTFFGEPRETSLYEGALEEEPIKAWLNGERLPTTIEFTQESAQKIFSAGIDKQVFMWGKASEFFTDAPVFKAVREVAKQFKGKLIFVTSNNEADSSQPITNYFGLKEATGPVLIGFYQQGNKKYRYTGDATDTAAIAAFAQGVLDGTAAGDYKGAPLPAEPKDEGVTVIVRDNFDEIVMDPKKDVFLEVYAPWCGHCKSLAPIWSEMAGKLAGVESVVIAKMDGTENEHAQAEVQGFPTLLFFPAEEGKKPVPYSGARDLESLLSFVAEQAKIPFEVEGVSKPEPKEDAEEEAEEGAKDEL